ncbi:DUF1524 domain-containing protein [Helicobacter pylori]|uniref:DUF1524 domain-containing protein n=1 Tax=Helicobacter pylori TaxID=210 RepID=UPI00041F10F1|nr:DUF1524 domain-containing protein [Helicobacter pylori]
MKEVRTFEQFSQNLATFHTDHIYPKSKFNEKNKRLDKDFYKWRDYLYNLQLLERALEWMEEDEILEVTPLNLRIRKKILDPNMGKRAKNR